MNEMMKVALKGFAKNSNIRLRPEIRKGAVLLSIYKGANMIDQIELKFNQDTNLSDIIKDK